MLNLGSWHDGLLSSVKRIFKEEAPPPYWQPGFTNGNPAWDNASCEEGGLVSGWRCEGKQCVNMTIRCEDWDLTPVGPTVEHSVESCLVEGRSCCEIGLSQERSKTCPPNMFVTKVQCVGCYCRTVHFTCSAFEGVTAVDCAWTDWFSDEDGGKMLLDSNQAVAGVGCNGQNCDAMRLYACSVSDM